MMHNSAEIQKRMKEKYSIEERKDLFFYPPCIVPAWEPYIDDMVELIEEWNETEEKNRHLRFFQIKQKFGQLVVYLEWKSAECNSSIDKNIPDHIQNAIHDIASNGYKTCLLCGEKKVQTVVNSRLQWKCLDHWENKGYFNPRDIL